MGLCMRVEAAADLAGRAGRGLRTLPFATAVSAGLLIATPFAAQPFALPGADPLFGVGWLVVAGSVVLAHELLRRRGAPAAACATAVGALFGISVGSALHEALPSHPAVAASQALLGLLWLAGAASIGRLVARHVTERVGWRRASALALGTGAATAWIVTPLLRVVRPGTTVAERVAWMLQEEDNAHVVGIARELLTLGPRAGDLAGEIGTGFVSTAVLGMRVLRLIEGDPRVTAITVFTVSTALAVLVLGAGMLLLQLSATRSRSAPGLLELGMLPLLSAAAAGVALALAVVLPMQTGFLTFVWAMAWLTVGVGAAPLLTATAGPGERLGLLLHLGASAVMLVSSWTFLAAGFLPVLLALVLAAPLRQLARSARRRWYVLVGALVILGAAIVPYFERSLIAQVIGLGRGALTTVASEIYYDRTVLWVVLVALVSGTGLVLRRHSTAAPAQHALLTFGPPIAVGVSWVGLWILAQFLTGGELNYAGMKLAYGFVAVAALLGLSGLVGVVTGRGTLLRVGVAALLLTAIVGSDVVRFAPSWYDRVKPMELPHAVAVADALAQSNSDLPIRCLPAPGTAVTDRSRWAAYFCVRWMEDAFNADRFHGHRFTFLEAQDPSFEESVLLARASGRYDFAVNMTLGPGWFGWNGTD
jgi:hypothetical protein